MIEELDWVDNAPADRMPQTLRKTARNYLLLVCVIIPSLFLGLEILDGGSAKQLFSVLAFALFLDLLFLITYFLIPLIDHSRIPKYVAFEDDKLLWKTKSGKEGEIPYSSIKSIAHTGREAIRNWKIVIVPLQEEIYSVIYELGTTSPRAHSTPARHKEKWVSPPQGITLNKDNAKRLVAQLKKNGVDFEGGLDD